MVDLMSLDPNTALPSDHWRDLPQSVREKQVFDPIRARGEPTRDIQSLATETRHDWS